MKTSAAATLFLASSSVTRSLGHAHSSSDSPRALARSSNLRRPRPYAPPEIFYGFSFDAATMPFGSLPPSAFEASASGWSPCDGDKVEGRGFLWKKAGEDGAYPFRLYYPSRTADVDADIVGFDVVGPALEGAINDIPPRGAKSIGNGMISYEITLPQRGRKHLTVGNVKVPSKVRAAEKRDWVELACLEPMGGSHYVLRDDLGDNVFQPIYEKYGSGDLNSLSLVFGPTNRTEFDGFGALVPYPVACTLVLGCVDGIDCFDPDTANAVMSTMHVYFADPARDADGSYPFATCQLGPGRIGGPGVDAPLSLCGSPGDSVEDLTAHLAPLLGDS